MQTYKEYCIEYVLNRIDDFIGNAYPDVFELAQDITMHDNVSGSMTYSTYDAIEYLKAWWHNIADFMETYENIFGEVPSTNAFNEPEKFHSLMVIIGIETLLGKVSFDDHGTLTKEKAEKIKETLRKVIDNE